MEGDLPNTLPQEAAYQIIAAFFIEYLPGIENEYKLLENACDGPPKIGLPDLQMETLIFGLHCLDRSVFANYGSEYRDGFMNSALAVTEEAFALALPDHLREHFLEHLGDRYNLRQAEYAAMPPVPEEGTSPKGTLFWEFAKYVCLEAGADPLALPIFIEEARTIFIMMNKATQGL